MSPFRPGITGTSFGPNVTDEQHTDHRKVQQSFQRSLDSYHQTALAQKRIAADLVQLLAAATPQRHFRHVLEFGCGTGLLTRALLDAFKIDTLFLNDILSAPRETLQDMAAPHVDAVSFIDGAIEKCALPSQLDLIISASTIQWVQDHKTLMSRLSRQLNADGWLALSGFGRDHFAELDSLGSSAGAPGYRDANEWEDLLPPELELVRVHQDHHVLYFETALELLRHLRATGVNARAGQPWSRRRLDAFEADYRARFDIDGKLPLTYSPVWIIARKR